MFPPANNEYAFSYHLGAGYIRSFLQQHSIETHQFVTSQEMTISDISEMIFTYKPETVGFTSYDTNYNYVRLLTKILKKRDPHLNVILGGPTATFSYQAIMNHTPEIDVCVIGEGEQTVLELIQKRFDDLESIKGITFRSHSGNLISTQRRPFISGGEKGAELDILPSPYLTGIIPPDGKTGVLASRGCVYKCTYCNFSIMYNYTVRYHSLDRIINELKVINDNWNPIRTDMIQIHDDIFSLNVKRAKILCQRIIDEGINLPLSLETRADHCDKELIYLMRDAGVQSINFGLESASLKVLKAIKKSPHKEKQFLNQIKSSVQWAKEADMTTSVSVIFGLPEEGMKEAEETLSFVKELNVDEYSHNVLHICAGTELFRTRKKHSLDVYHSPHFLPYKTKRAFDVAKITPLPHSGLRREFNLWRRMYYNLLSYEADRITRGCKYLMIKNLPEDMKGFCTWLKEISLLSVSCFDCSDGITKEKGLENFALLLRNGVPVGSYALVAKNGEPHLTSVATWMELNSPVPELPFHQYKRESHGLFTLEQPQDVEALAHFLNRYVKNGILSFRAHDVSGTLVNSCRWGEHLCPALSGGVLVVNGNKVLPCYNGESIGKVGDSIQDLREALENMLREKEEERGCHDCLVKEECSHCLFLQPLTDDKFCELRRIYPHISKVLTVLGWLHHFYQDDPDTTIMVRIDKKASPLFYQGESKRGNPLPRMCDDVRLAFVDGKAFAFTIEEFKSFSLGSTLAVILEAFQMGVSKESLVSYLCESAKVDTEEALNAISDAIILLRKKGFLETDEESTR